MFSQFRCKIVAQRVNKYCCACEWIHICENSPAPPVGFHDATILQLQKRVQNDKRESLPYPSAPIKLHQVINFVRISCRVDALLLSDERRCKIRVFYIYMYIYITTVLKRNVSRDTIPSEERDDKRHPPT